MVDKFKKRTQNLFLHHLLINPSPELQNPLHFQDLATTIFLKPFFHHFHHPLITIHHHFIFPSFSLLFLFLFILFLFFLLLFLLKYIVGQSHFSQTDHKTNSNHKLTLQLQFSWFWLVSSLFRVLLLAPTLKYDPSPQKNNN